MRLFTILNSIYNIILLTALVVGIIKFKKLSKPLRTVFLFVAFGGLTEIALEILDKFRMHNSTPVGNLYFPVAFLILGLFYYLLLKAYINKRILIGIITAFVLLCIINLIFIQDLMEFPNIVAAIGALVVIVFSILQFSKVISEAKIKKLSADPLIWINISFLVYYSANLFYFILFNLNFELNLEFAKLIHLYFVGANILLYLLITVGFLKVKGNTNF